MIITNIPHKENADKNHNKFKNKFEKIEIEDNNNAFDNKFKFLFKGEKEDKDIMKKIPRIKKYYSLVMNNFYTYSKQNRVITKNTRGNNILLLKNTSITNTNYNFKSLPNIYCKTPDEKIKEIKNIEEEYDTYNNMKLLEKDKSKNNILFYDEERDRIMKKIINSRLKLKKVKNENNMRLLNIIKLNNSKIEKIFVINKLSKNIINYLKEREKNKGNIVNEELLLKWYENYMRILSETNEYKKDIKIKNNLEMIKNNLSVLVELKIKEIKKADKKENKLKIFIEIKKHLKADDKIV